MQAKICIMPQDWQVLKDFQRKFPLYKNLARCDFMEIHGSNMYQINIFYDSIEGLCKFFKKFGRYSLTYDLNELDIKPRENSID